MTLPARRFFSPGFQPTARQEEEFFANLQLASGVTKFTSHGRFADINRVIHAKWRELGATPRTALDVAVSSAITTLEWLNDLRRDGFDVVITATDYTLKGRLLRLGRFYRVLVDPSGFVLQHEFMGMAIRPWRRWRDYLTGHFVPSWIFNRIAAGLRARGALDGAVVEREVMLVSPKASQTPGIEFQEGDVFAPDERLNGRFDVVRAANILNLAFYPETQLELGVRNLRRMLRGAGAFLIVNRTHADGVNNGTLFRLGDDGRFSALVRFGKGSEIEHVVLRA